MPILHAVVDRDTPEITRRLLREACLKRDVVYVEHDGALLDPLAAPLPEGSLLYMAGASPAAVRAECVLWQPGVVSFHRGVLGPLEFVRPQHLALARAGLPVPRSVQPQAITAEILEGIVEHLGGFPVLVRLDGGEGGVGITRVDSFTALLSLVQLLLAQGMLPRLVSFVPDGMHWRVVVLGDVVLTAYLNPVKAGDFRSTPSLRPSDYGLVPPPEVARLALDAAQVSRTEFAGVDVLVHPSGRVYLLEANFPCYFPQSTEVADIDVAGPMVDHLLAKQRARIPHG